MCLEAIPPGKGLTAIIVWRYKYPATESLPEGMGFTYQPRKLELKHAPYFLLAFLNSPFLITIIKSGGYLSQGRKSTTTSHG